MQPLFIPDGRSQEMKMRIFSFLLLCSALNAAEVALTPQTDVAACVQALAQDGGRLKLKAQSFELLSTPEYQRLLQALEAAGVNDIDVRVRSSLVDEADYDSLVLSRIAQPQGKGWVQYSYAYDAEAGVVSPVEYETTLRTPGGRLLTPPYSAMDTNLTPWSADGRYLVLAGYGAHYVIDTAAPDVMTSVPDWENQPKAEGVSQVGGIHWVGDRCFEFSSWNCGCCYSVFRYDIASRELTKLKTVKREHKRRRKK